MKIKLIFLSMVFLLACGCSSVPLKLQTDMADKGYDTLGEGEGSATGIMLFGVIPIGQNTRFQEAYQDAVNSKGGDALLNPVISERWYWAYVLNGYTTTISGTVIKFKK